jgi:hypothetical protein
VPRKYPSCSSVSAAAFPSLSQQCKCVNATCANIRVPNPPPLPAAFGEVKKRVRTTAGGSTGSVRNLRIREDTAKYLLNLDTNSAHYDPKSRSMREDPNPNKVRGGSFGG